MMHKQTVDTAASDDATVSEFEQCPVCESYQIIVDDSHFCCKRCGMDWVAVRRFEE